MVRVDGSAVGVGADRVASGFLALDQRVEILLADGLGVAEVEEQRRFSLVPDLVVDHGGTGMMPIAFEDEAAAGAAGVVIAL